MPASPESRRHLSSAATLPCTKRLVVGPWLCTGQTNSGQRLMTGWPEWYATLLLSGGLNNGRWRQEDCSGSCWRCDWLCQGGPVGAAIGAGLAFYMAEQQEKLNANSPLRDSEPSAQTVRSSKAPARFILGRVSTGGVLVWAQEQVGGQTNGEWLHLVYVLCEGPVDARRKSIWVKKRSARMANMPHTS